MFPYIRFSNSLEKKKIFNAERKTQKVFPLELRQDEIDSDLMNSDRNSVKFPKFISKSGLPFSPKSGAERENQNGL